MRYAVALLILALLAGLGAAGWYFVYRPMLPTSPGVASEPAPPEPADTVRRLIELRASRAYGKMHDLIVPGQSQPIIQTLLAIDRLLGANDALRSYVLREFGHTLARAVDQSAIENNLGIFSPRVECVDTRIEGEVAVVAFTVQGKLPLRRTELRIVDGVWRYDPGEGYSSRLPGALTRMAEGLEQVLRELRTGALPAEAIRADADLLPNEIMVRLQPGVRMLPAPPSEDEP